LAFVVYMCQKSQILVDALICYKQKCKVASFNLAHPVGWLEPRYITDRDNARVAQPTIWCTDGPPLVM